MIEDTLLASKVQTSIKSLKKTLKKALTKYTGGYLFSVQPVFLTNW